jgi:hypothetical protein
MIPPISLPLSLCHSSLHAGIQGCTSVNVETVVDLHQQDDILLAVLDIVLLALLVPNSSQLELVTYIAIDAQV